jgi:hypothetical protein
VLILRRALGGYGRGKPAAATWKAAYIDAM